ncbi:MAG: glycosyltransferase family 2 protein [Acidobacteriota bacterium]|nr:glycosyltransferase family 2 protein [Acidobacteriota bacterium]
MTGGGQPGTAGGPRSVGAVVVNHDAGEALAACVGSLRREGVDEVVVVDNASTDGSADRLLVADPGVLLVRAVDNLGDGSGVNRGLREGDRALVLVCNPDVVVHPGALGALVDALLEDDRTAVVGPCILETDGSRYPSARRFPSWLDAAGHALFGIVRPDNPFTGRYRMTDLDTARPSVVDWVSGACFLVRRSVLEELGGFDERYFMYLEDTDLCWRVGKAGYRVRYVPGATVSHLRGHSTARRPYRMLVAHHRSALRFAATTTTGWRRVGLPVVALVLGLRLVVATALRALGGGPRAARDPEAGRVG